MRNDRFQGTGVIILGTVYSRIDRPDGHLVQRLLELFFELVYHPDLSGNPSAASIYFALKEGVYTILIDEVDRNESH